MGPRPLWALDVWRGADPGGLLLPQSNTVTLGRRGFGADFQVDDPRISKMHATFHTEADGTVTVLNTSTNGLFVNGQAVAKGYALRLQHGDIGS